MYSSVEQFGQVTTERRSVTSCYHGFKISEPQQFFLTETAICTLERRKKSMGYRFVPECNAHENSYVSIFFCHSLSRSTEILIPWLRDASSSPPYSKNYVLSLKADYFFFRVSGIHVKLSHPRFSRLATSLLASCVFEGKKRVLAV